jgi:hypothetical protein
VSLLGLGRHAIEKQKALLLCFLDHVTDRKAARDRNLVELVFAMELRGYAASEQERTARNEDRSSHRIASTNFSNR